MKFPLKAFTEAYSLARKSANEYGGKVPRIVHVEGGVPTASDVENTIELDLTKPGAVSEMLAHELGHLGIAPGFNGVGTSRVLTAELVNELLRDPTKHQLVNVAEDAAINMALEKAHPGYLQRYQEAAGVVEPIATDTPADDAVAALRKTFTGLGDMQLALAAATVGNYNAARHFIGSNAAHALEAYVEARLTGRLEVAKAFLQDWVQYADRATAMPGGNQFCGMGHEPEELDHEKMREIREKLVQAVPDSDPSRVSGDPHRTASGWDEGRIARWTRILERIQPRTPVPIREPAVVGKRLARRTVEAGGDLSLNPRPFLHEVEPKAPRNPRVLVFLDRSGSMHEQLNGPAAHYGPASLAAALSRVWDTDTVFCGRHIGGTRDHALVRGELREVDLATYPIQIGAGEGNVAPPQGVDLSDYDGLVFLSDGRLASDAIKSASRMFRQMRDLGKGAVFAYTGAQASTDAARRNALAIAGDKRWVIMEESEDEFARRVPMLLRRLFMERR